VQTIEADSKCQKLWDLLQSTRKAETLTMHDIIRYRREAERHVGSDENLYRFEWVRITPDRSAKINFFSTIGESDKDTQNSTDGEKRSQH
jgi:paired amphipathic helix protein Sin3a